MAVHKYKVAEERRIRTIRRYLLQAIAFLTGRIRWRQHLAIGAFKLGRPKIPFLLPQRIRSAVSQVGAHEPFDALIIRKAVLVPNILRQRARRKIRDEFNLKGKIENRWALRAVRQVMYIMQSAGYVPLVQNFDPYPNYSAAALGIEYHSQTRYAGYPHQLPEDPATILPWLPFGPGLFGYRESRFPAAYSPDLLVFIVLEKSETLTQKLINIGPRLFSLDHLVKFHLTKTVIERLRQPVFQISGDARLGIFPREEIDDQKEFDNRFGEIHDISIMGGTKDCLFFRIDLRENRMRVGSNFGEAGHDAALNSLRSALENMLNECPRTNLKRGDIIIVNNRRIATRWDRRAPLITPAISASRGMGMNVWGDEKKLEPGDRIVLQMGFYLPELITPSSSNKVDASQREATTGDKSQENNHTRAA